MFDKLGVALVVGFLATTTAGAREDESATGPASETNAPAPADEATPQKPADETTAPASTSEKRAPAPEPAEEPIQPKGLPALEPAPVDPRYGPATGSVLGPWGFFELSGALALGSLGSIGYGPNMGGWLSLNGGWGFDAGPVHLRPAAQFGIGLQTPVDSENGRALTWSPVGLTLSATDLLNERLTAPLGLRLTPTLGLAIPTSAEGGWAVTTISLGAQLERRFGPVELALRARAAKPIAIGLASTGNWAGSSRTTILCRTGESICSGPPFQSRWILADSFLAEGWLLKSLSVGLELSWNFVWSVSSVSAAPDEYSCRALDSSGNPTCASGTAVSTRIITASRFFVSWAFFDHLGLSVELTNIVDHGFAPGFPFFSARPGFYPVAWVNLWVRTDPALQRSWLEQ